MSSMKTDGTTRSAAVVRQAMNACSRIEEMQCRIVATREADFPLWTFYLINDGEATIGSVELAAVRYEWGDQYVGGESPGTRIARLEPGARALIWRDDGSSETRIDLWLRMTLQELEAWLLFEFPKLYRQKQTTLTAHPTRMKEPPGGIP
jgi:hypothetical protein